MAAHNETESAMSIYKTWRLTRQLPLKNTVEETLCAYAATR